VDATIKGFVKKAKLIEVYYLGRFAFGVMDHQHPRPVSVAATVDGAVVEGYDVVRPKG